MAPKRINNAPTFQIGFPGDQGPDRHINFRVNFTDLMTIRGNGNVGIGTTDPLAKLDIRNAGGSRMWFEETTSLANGIVPQFNLSANESLSAGMLLVANRINSEPALQIGFGGEQGPQRNFLFRANFKDLMLIKGNGNIGVGTIDPKSKLQVANGDVYIENIGNGVIMKSPNGQCWRTTVSNTGQLVATAITCPN
jgi:hypothetical protein